MAASSARVAGVRSTAPTTPARVRTWRPIITFSSADRFAKSRMFWNVRAMPRAVTSCGFSPARDCSSNVKSPASGA